MLSGYKTHIIGIAGILYAAYGFFFMHLDGNTAFQIVQIALASMGLRSAIANS